MIDKMTVLVGELRRLPGARVDLMVFDRGGARLDVYRGGRHFLMAWLPTYQMFGVDEVKEDEGFLASYRFGSYDFESAAEELWTLARSAPTPTPPSLIDSTTVGSMSSGTEVS